MPPFQLGTHTSLSKPFQQSSHQSWTPPLRIWKGAGGVQWTTSALRLSFFVALQLWSAFLPASVAAQKGEGLPIFEQVGPNYVNPH